MYLLENGVCVAKKKTKTVRKSLDPLYNQVLVFSESPQGKVVQVKNIHHSPNSMYLPQTLESIWARQMFKMTFLSFAKFNIEKNIIDV